MQILAAHRYGIKRVILPERNLKDLVEVPSAVLGSLEVSSFSSIERYISQLHQSSACLKRSR